MMVGTRTSETSVDNYSTRQYNPEDKSELLEIQYMGGFPCAPLGLSLFKRDSPRANIARGASPGCRCLDTKGPSSCSQKDKTGSRTVSVYIWQCARRWDSIVKGDQLQKANSGE
jgi:hypothetical protein